MAHALSQVCHVHPQRDDLRINLEFLKGSHDSHHHYFDCDENMSAKNKGKGKHIYSISKIRLTPLAGLAGKRTQVCPIAQAVLIGTNAMKSSDVGQAKSKCRKSFLLIISVHCKTFLLLREGLRCGHYRWSRQCPLGSQRGRPKRPGLTPWLQPAFSDS